MGRWATLALLLAAAPAVAVSILFVGNSFTYGQGSAVRFYRAESVHDLNAQGVGGVPALFKAFTEETGLAYDVSLETQPGVGLEWHIDHALARLERRPWDAVVLQGYSTLDAKHPGDPAELIADVHKLAAAFRAKNAAVQIRLTATWPRADQVYVSGGAWYGKSVEAMAHDVRAGYDQAATPGIAGVVPVGEAWLRAFRAGIADPNPYDGIDAGKVDLWAFDHYHASTYGYYLEALMLYGTITGRDPRALGEGECAGYELGLAPPVMEALQAVAFEELQAQRMLKSGGSAADMTPAPAADPRRCAGVHGH